MAASRPPRRNSTRVVPGADATGRRVRADASTWEDTTQTTVKATPPPETKGEVKTKRVNVNIAAEAHQQLRIWTVQHDTDISGVVRGIVDILVSSDAARSDLRAALVQELTGTSE